MRPRYVSVFSILILAGCSIFPAWSQTSDAEKVLGPGWQCLLVPTSFDGPGTIFSIDPRGTKSRIVDLSRPTKSTKAIPIETERAEIGVITSGSNMNVSVAVSMLQTIAPGLAKLWAAGQHADVSKIEYRDVEEETTFDADLKPILGSWLKQNSKEYLAGPPKTRYFVVRDAYRAGIVNYHFSKDNVAALGGEGTFKNLFSANASLNGDIQAGYDLSQKFARRLRVCIRTYELTETRGVSAEAGYQIDPRDGVVPEIRKEKED